MGVNKRNITLDKNSILYKLRRVFMKKPIIKVNKIQP